MEIDSATGYPLALNAEEVFQGESGVTLSARYRFESREFFIPVSNRDRKTGVWTAVPDDEREQNARNTFLLLEAMDSCFGKGQVGVVGSFALQEHYDVSAFSIRTIDFATTVLREAMDATGEVSHSVKKRIYGHYVFSNLFRVYSRSATASRFPSKSSPLRIGAKRAGQNFIERFDQSTESKNWWEAEAFTLPEMILILEETRKYAEEILESCKVEVTDTNVAALLHLLHVRSLKVVKETMAAMPYLKVTKSLDKNLALCVGRGLDYTRMLTFAALDSFPGDDELDELLKLPYSIQVGISRMK